MTAQDPAVPFFSVMPVSLAAKLVRSIRDTQRRRSADGLGVDRELDEFAKVILRAYGGLEGTSLDGCRCSDESEDMTNASRLLTYDEVASRLSISDRQVKRLVQEGSLLPVHLGRAARVHTDDLEAYMSSLREGIST